MPSDAPVSLSQAVESLAHDGHLWARSAAGRVEHVPLREALGRVLAHDLAARADQPSLDDSALDGLACRALDAEDASPSAPVRLRVVGESAAGRPFDGRVGPGEAVRIQTGAAIPEGADAVLGVEDFADEGDRAVLNAPAAPDAVRHRGRNVREGEVGLTAGQRLDAATLALAGAMGHGVVPVAPRPRVALLITGDELVDPGEPLRPGQTFDGNAAALFALVRAAGALPVALPRVPDRAGALEERLEGVDVDLVISSGGISMGRYDRVRDHLSRHGRLVFRKVLIKPGGPATYARVRDVPWLALPGNPVSVLITFLILGRAWIDRATGRRGPLPGEATLPASAGGPLHAAGPKTTFARVSVAPEGRRLVARALPDQNSAVVGTVAYADALALLPPHARLQAGDPVDVIPLARHLG